MGCAMARAAALVPVLLALAFCLCVSPAVAGTFSYNASADTYVDSSSPKKEFGTLNRVWTNENIPVDQTFVRFKVSGLTGTVTNAVLRMYVADGTSDGPAVYKTTDAWSEKTTNWNNRPSRTSGPRDDKDSLSTGRWVEWDVTPWVTSGGSFDFTLRGGGGNPVKLTSRESTRDPKLVVTTADSPPPPPAACADGLDNDGDGLVDLADPGCSGWSDDDETNAPPPPPPACADGLDNDGDGLVDLADPGCSSTSDDDETNAPPPPPPGDEPAAVAGLGYHQAFRDDFDTIDRSVWDDHIWYDEPPKASWAGYQSAENGVLHLRTRRDWYWGSGSSDNYPINTITTQSSGLTFTQGYFEARMKWTGARGAWPGFWLFSYRHSTNDFWPSINPFCANNGLPKALCYSAELDVFEGQGAEPNVFYGTIHRNSSGDYGIADQQNDNNYQDQPSDIASDWHTYGMLWTSSQITWYLDGRALMSAPTYDSTNQPMYLLLQMWTGGWMGDPNSTTPDLLETQVDYVDVWQK
jgi:beta-glucanase (GH16 family)